MDADNALAEIREANGAHLPASDRLIAELAAVVQDLRQHEQSGSARPGDIYSSNLHGWMGERMPMVLARMINREAELAEANAKLKIAEGQAQDLDAKLAERTRQRDGLLAALDYDEKAVPA